MATIAELILQNVKTTLEGVTTGAGYENTINRVERFEQDGNRKDNPPFAIFSLAELQEETAKGSANGKLAWRMGVDVWVWTVHDKTTDARTTDAVVTSLFNDALKALMQDTTRAGKALGTEVIGATRIDAVEGQPFTGILLECNIYYRHLNTDPAVV